MSKRPPRRLDSKEEALWNRVAKSARPLQKPAPRTPRPLPAKPVVAKLTPDWDIPPFSIGSRADTAIGGHDIAPPLSERLSGAPVKMDKKAFQKMKRGRTAPEARIDLHGMTVAAAEARLRAFLHGAHADGKRLVLVITGKGRRSDDAGPIPTRIGVLRHELPLWLSRPPLSAIVLQVAEAHRTHGGSGAFYVYLRRR